jgi:hypothetical protein
MRTLKLLAKLPVPAGPQRQRRGVEPVLQVDRQVAAERRPLVLLMVPPSGSLMMPA